MLGAGLIGTIVWVACKAEHRHAPLVTTDSEPHDVNKPNPEAQQPDVETFRGLFKANRKVAENDNRNEEEATVPLANVPQPVCQPDQDSNCQELFA